MIQHRLEPDELTVKHLGMLGSAALLLAHSVRGRHAANNTVAGRARQPGHQLVHRAQHQLTSALSVQGSSLETLARSRVA